MNPISLPYVGIRPFEQDDWPIFFGREALSNQLLHKLETNRFVAVVGSSGSGKSSLVKAGLLPLIEHGFLMNARDWLTLVCRPGSDPWASLSLELARAEQPNATLKSWKDAPLTCDLIRAQLRTSHEGIVPALERLNLSDSTHVLLVIDQFEELFGFRSVPHSGAAREEAERYVKCILDSCSATVPAPLHKIKHPLPLAQRIWVILTMRSDFLGNCEIFPQLSKKVSESHFLVSVLEPEQKKEAVLEPRLAATIERANYRTFEFDDGLASIIVNETEDRPDQLPLMQHALMRAWSRANDRAEKDGASPPRLTHADYEAVGRLDRALSLHADEALKSIESDKHKTVIAQRLFLLLCDFSPDGQIIRRRPKVAEVMRVAGAAVQDVESVVRLFQADNRCFLITSPPGVFSEDTRVDVSHESLIRQWEALNSTDGWLEKERTAVAGIKRLVQDAELYNKGSGSKLDFVALERVRNWQESCLPTLEWAFPRYVSETEWAVAMEYLEKSRYAAEEKKKEVEENELRIRREKEEEELRRRRFKIITVFAGLAMMAFTVMVILWKQASDARNTEENERRKVEKNKDDAEAFLESITKDTQESSRLIIEARKDTQRLQEDVERRDQEIEKLAGELKTKEQRITTLNKRVEEQNGKDFSMLANLSVKERENPHPRITTMTIHWDYEEQRNLVEKLQVEFSKAGFPSVQAEKDGPHSTGSDLPEILRGIIMPILGRFNLSDYRLSFLSRPGPNQIPRVDIYLPTLQSEIASLIAKLAGSEREMKSALSLLTAIGQPALTPLLKAASTTSSEDNRLALATAVKKMRRGIKLNETEAKLAAGLLRSAKPDAPVKKNTRSVIADIFMALSDGDSIRSAFAELQLIFQSRNSIEVDSTIYYVALVVGTWARTLHPSITGPDSAIPMRDTALKTAKGWREILAQNSAKWAETIDLFDELIARIEPPPFNIIVQDEHAKLLPNGSGLAIYLSEFDDDSISVGCYVFRPPGAVTDNHLEEEDFLALFQSKPKKYSLTLERAVEVESNGKTFMVTLVKLNASSFKKDYATLQFQLKTGR